MKSTGTIKCFVFIPLDNSRTILSDSLVCVADSSLSARTLFRVMLSVIGSCDKSAIIQHEDIVDQFKEYAASLGTKYSIQAGSQRLNRELGYVFHDYGSRGGP